MPLSSICRYFEFALYLAHDGQRCRRRRRGIPSTGGGGRNSPNGLLRRVFRASHTVFSTDRPITSTTPESIPRTKRSPTAVEGIPSTSSSPAAALSIVDQIQRELEIAGDQAECHRLKLKSDRPKTPMATRRIFWIISHNLLSLHSLPPR